MAGRAMQHFFNPASFHQRFLHQPQGATAWQAKARYLVLADATGNHGRQMATLARLDAGN